MDLRNGIGGVLRPIALCGVWEAVPRYTLGNRARFIWVLKTIMGRRLSGMLHEGQTAASVYPRMYVSHRGRWMVNVGWESRRHDG